MSAEPQGRDRDVQFKAWVGISSTPARAHPERAQALRSKQWTLYFLPAFYVYVCYVLKDWRHLHIRARIHNRCPGTIAGNRLHIATANSLHSRTAAFCGFNGIFEIAAP